MGAENMFRKVFGRKGVNVVSAPEMPVAGTLHPTLMAELHRLDLIKTGLARKAQNFVLAGEDRGFLAQLEAIMASTPRYSSPYFKDNNARNATQGKVDVALAKGEMDDAAIIGRFFAIRLRVSPSIDQRTYTNLNYSDTQMLASEVFCAVAAGDRRLNSHGDHVNPHPAVVPTLTPPQMMQLVCDVGGDPVEYFRWAGPEMIGDRLNKLRPQFAEAFAGLVANHPDAFAAVFRLMPNEAQMLRLLARAQQCDALRFPHVVIEVVALLSKGRAKQSRAHAILALARLDPAELLALLERHLPTGDIETRHGLVEAAARAPTPEILALLAERAKVEKAAKVQAAIAGLLEVETASTAAVETDSPSSGASYPAVTGAFVTVPPRRDLGGEAIPTPTDEACISFVALVEQLEDRRRKATEDYNARYAANNRTPSPPPVPYTRSEIEAAFATLTAAATLPEGPAKQLVSIVRHHPEGQAWLRSVLEQVPVAGRLRILKATGFDDIRGVLGLNYAYRSDELFGIDHLREWAAVGQIDLRDIASADDLRNVLVRRRSSYRADGIFDAIDAIPTDSVWPWIAESMEVLDEALGLRPAAASIPIDRSLAVLAILPATPQRYLPRLLEIAATEKRPLRLQAMALLRDAKDLPKRIEALLDDKRQPVRINAAGWLADIRATASEAALRKRLKKEKSDPVRTALIIALQRLGADLADVIGPASLIAEAKAASAKAPPRLPERLTRSGLPVVRFRDGATVPQDVVEHWLALAIRLKDPGAHGQFGIYLDQLEPADARTLSGWVLESWIAYDTTGPTHEEASAYARSSLGRHYVLLNGKVVSATHLPPDEQERLIAKATREKMGDLINSGSDTKGLLALACRADPVWAAARARWFLKKHGRRSNQAMALLEALAGTGAPAALQVVIAASTRLKQKSTQARAAEIAQRFADDRGWSVDELADRTVPSAGFDDDGTLDLPCGEDAKPYVARLDAALAIHLFNPDGKPIKALPAGDDDNTKESKKAFTAAKKELTQIITLQGERLFEAMCVERQWPVADWRLAFHQHPVMRRLIERLVWQGLDADGQPLGLFRPTQEGDFTDAADNDVAIDDFAAIRLAHGALVDAETCAAWTAHLKDYEVKPFLAQFDTLRSPLTAELAEAEAITDRQGWAADSLTFRGASEKRGYQRVMRDSGGCHEYVKEFPSHGITATIWHTGSYAVDDNNRVALKELKITKSGHRGPYRLKDVPPVMLAECWADYHAVAAKGAFDPEWETISPW